MTFRKLSSPAPVLLAAMLIAGCAAPRVPLSTPSASSSATVPAAPRGGPVLAATPAPVAPATQPARSLAVANLVTPAGQPAGRADLTETPAGVEIVIRVQGLKPGMHGFHVHANGACMPGPDPATGQVVAFGAAGGHFDPGQSNNHGRPGQALHEAHGGELPNITVGADGTGTLRHVNANLTLAAGKQSVMGRTLVVHEDADDYQSDPAGNSGGRALCGLIAPAQGGAVTGRTVFEGGNVYPEGVAVDARSGNAYVGSSREGHIYRIAPEQGDGKSAGENKAEMFQAGGSPGRQSAYGMKVDGSGRLWVAGGQAGSVAVIDLASAATLAILKTPPDSHTFLNDLVASNDGYVYVTDSFRPVLFRSRIAGVAGGAGGTTGASGAPGPLEPWLALDATPIRYVPNQVNLNGIVASADGRRLLAVQQFTGQLWRIETETKVVTEVRVAGGDLKNGDGLVLTGVNELMVLRNADNELLRLELSGAWDSARIVQRIGDPRLKYPTSAAATARGLLVVNGQLDRLKDPQPLLPFDMLTLGLPAR